MRPYEHLPIPMPKDYDPGEAFFYNNFVQPFITDMIKMMSAGLHVDERAVDALRLTVGDVLTEVDAKLLRNPMVQKYQEKRSKKAQKAHYSKHTQNTRDAEYYYKEYDGSMLHRTWLVNTYLKSIHAEKDCRDKWSVADLKNYNIFISKRNFELIHNFYTFLKVWIMYKNKHDIYLRTYTFLESNIKTIDR